MLKKRLIACLIVRDGLIVQSVGFNKYLPIGYPRFSIEFVARWDVDEIVLLDISSTKDNGSINKNTLKDLTKVCFVPLTVGGGIKSVDDALNIIKAGADKVSINTYAVERPEIITEISEKFGSQCVVVSIDCRLESNGKYQVYTDSGAKATGLNPIISILALLIGIKVAGVVGAIISIPLATMGVVLLEDLFKGD